MLIKEVNYELKITVEHLGFHLRESFLKETRIV